MTAPVCARCEAIVTTDNKIPTTPTRIPTRREFGSAACSGVTSISGMRFKVPLSLREFSSLWIFGRDFNHHVLHIVHGYVGQERDAGHHTCEQRPIHRRQHTHRRSAPERGSRIEAADIGTLMQDHAGADKTTAGHDLGGDPRYVSAE